MLVATFAISFLLQNVYLLAFGSRGKTVGTLGGLNGAFTVGSLDIRWISIVALVVGGVLLAATTLLLNRTTIGLQMRAAAADFRTARILGVRANRVISFSFLVSGVLAAAVSVLLTVQDPLVTPEYGVSITIFALIGVVVGGLDRLSSAALGGFAIGFANSFVGARLPTSSSVYLPSVDLRPRDPRARAAPGRPLRAAPPRGGARVKAVVQLAGPIGAGRGGRGHREHGQRAPTSSSSRARS